jgi:hypothetical protein
VVALRWFLGSVLGFVYALRHPRWVSEIVMMGIATGLRAETDLLTQDLGRIFPEAWQQFLPDRYVLDRAGELAGIPGVLVQGTLDFNNLLGTPWELHRAWPGSELVMTKAGHDTSTPGVAEALVAATDKFRQALDGITGIHCSPRVTAYEQMMAATLCWLR